MSARSRHAGAVRRQGRAAAARGRTPGGEAIKQRGRGPSRRGFAGWLREGLFHRVRIFGWRHGQLCRCPIANFGHTHAAGPWGLCGRCGGRFRPPSPGKIASQFAGTHAAGTPGVYCGDEPRDADRPPGLSGSPAPSRGCLPGPQEEGSTKPRPPQRGRGLPGRMWALSWAPHRKPLFRRAFRGSASDCKSAIVGSTPTGASCFGFAPAAVSGRGRSSPRSRARGRSRRSARNSPCRAARPRRDRSSSRAPRRPRRGPWLPARASRRRSRRRRCR